eukprot:964871-Prymnesium_polylepis.1
MSSARTPRRTVGASHLQHHHRFCTQHAVHRSNAGWPERMGRQQVSKAQLLDRAAASHHHTREPVQLHRGGMTREYDWHRAARASRGLTRRDGHRCGGDGEEGTVGHGEVHRCGRSAVDTGDRVKLRQPTVTVHRHQLGEAVDEHADACTACARDALRPAVCVLLLRARQAHVRLMHELHVAQRVDTAAEDSRRVHTLER